MKHTDAYLEDFHTVTVIIGADDGENPPFHLVHDDERLRLHIVERQAGSGPRKLIARSDTPIRPEIPYRLIDTEGFATELKSGRIVRTEAFDRDYYYEGDDLGVTYTEARTTFKMWTPIAREPKVLLRKRDATEEHPMRYDGRGVFVAVVEGDLERTPYRFQARINGKTKVFTDPYAIASDANGVWNYVVDPARFHPLQNERPRHKMPPVIYEASIRDLTMGADLATVRRGTFLAASTKGLRTEEGRPVGFDHIRSLGITHVQFLPFFDFEGVDEKDPTAAYNWGYNPSQYNVPEGSYASDPTDPYARIDELRQMIDAYHNEGIGIVMDVVFNHVYNDKTHPFGRMLPGYFFRVDHHGHLTAASGCENDLATERRMVRKFIKDSLLFWAKTYRIDGFRFDLMGLIDKDTMHAAAAALHEVDENILVYGEGWNIPSVLPRKRLSHLDNPDMDERIGFFNDTFREVVKGSTFELAKKGFATGAKPSAKTMTKLLGGGTGLKPALQTPRQALNYVECHDNHTFFDKTTKAMQDADGEDRRRAQKLATALVVLAQGVPFLHAGQEFYRTKKGIGNSYKSPDDVNRIDWSLLDAHHGDVDDVRKLIRLRAEHPLFRLEDKKEIHKKIAVETKKSGTLLYRLRDEKEHLLVIFKNNPSREHFRFPAPARPLFHSEAGLDQGCHNELELTRISTTVMKLGKDGHT